MGQIDIVELADKGVRTVLVAVFLTVFSKLWGVFDNLVKDKDNQIEALKKELKDERKFYRTQAKEDRESYLKSLEAATVKIGSMENEIIKLRGAVKSVAKS